MWLRITHFNPTFLEIKDFSAREGWPRDMGQKNGNFPLPDILKFPQGPKAKGRYQNSLTATPVFSSQLQPNYVGKVMIGFVF